MMSQNKPKVLVADDNHDMLVVLRGWLEEAGMEVITASSGSAALKHFDDSISAVLMDLRMPGMDGIQTLEALKQRDPDVQCIMVTGEKDTRSAVQAMKAGACDYVTKPPHPEELLLLILQAIRAHTLTRENAGLRAVLDPRSSPTWLGHSPASTALLKRVAQVARSDSPVLITGETGTGKSLLAHMIHDMSKRKAAPFITVSCAAIPGDLVESELFGHEKGSFTGATRDRPGRMEIAENGSLFLDEIGEVPLIVQPKILRVLQEREFERVGGNTTQHMNARIIAATNRDLEHMCEQHEFREDLFYRLNVLHLQVPPLRERPEDIRPLIEQLMQRLSDSQNLAKQLSNSAWKYAENYSWPGNVRELQNALERAVTFSEGETITPDDLALHDRNNTVDKSHHLAGLTMDEIEKRAIEETLAACQGNKAEAARRLAVSEKTIYNKIKQLNISTTP